MVRFSNCLYLDFTSFRYFLFNYCLIINCKAGHTRVTESHCDLVTVCDLASFYFQLSNAQERAIPLRCNWQEIVTMFVCVTYRFAKSWYTSIRKHSLAYTNCEYTRFSRYRIIYWRNSWASQNIGYYRDILYSDVPHEQNYEECSSILRPQWKIILRLMVYGKLHLFDGTPNAHSTERLLRIKR